jgi:hypothetical protein
MGYREDMRAVMPAKRERRFEGLSRIIGMVPEVIRGGERMEATIVHLDPVLVKETDGADGIMVDRMRVGSDADTQHIIDAINWIAPDASELGVMIEYIEHDMGEQTVASALYQLGLVDSSTVFLCLPGYAITDEGRSLIMDSGFRDEQGIFLAHVAGEFDEMEKSARWRYKDICVDMSLMKTTGGRYENCDTFNVSLPLDSQQLSYIWTRRCAEFLTICLTKLLPASFMLVRDDDLDTISSAQLVPYLVESLSYGMIRFPYEMEIIGDAFGFAASKLSMPAEHDRIHDMGQAWWDMKVFDSESRLAGMVERQNKAEDYFSDEVMELYGLWSDALSSLTEKTGVPLLIPCGDGSVTPDAERIVHALADVGMWFGLDALIADMLRKRHDEGIYSGDYAVLLEEPED